jgi:hypothetical protein
MSERNSIQRFFGKNAIGNTDLLMVLKSLFSSFSGGEINLDGENQFLSEKMDALFCCFGIDAHEKFFMSSNNVGPVTADNKEEFNNIYLIDFYKSFSYLEMLEPFQSALRNIYNNIGPVKFCAELFPTLTHTGDHNNDVVFVATKYNKRAFGEGGAFFIFSVDRWNPSVKSWVPFEDANQKSIVVESLLAADTSKWRMYELNKHGKMQGKLKADLTPYTSIMTDDEKFGMALKVLKKNDENKQNFLTVLNKTRAALQESLDMYAESTSSIFGDVQRRYPIEGVVLNVNLIDGRNMKLKGTSKKFTEQKEANWKVRNQLTALEKKFTDNLMTNVLGLKSADSKFVDEKIKQVVACFRSSNVGEKRENEFIERLLGEIQEVPVSDAEVKIGMKSAIDEAEYELEKIKDTEFASDPDTQSKNDRLVARFQKILDFFRKYSGVQFYQGKQFVNYIAKLVLAKRLEPVSSSIKESVGANGAVGSSAGEPTKSIIWLGRAQPWHVGHHKMIIEGINQAKIRGAKEICIFVVKGKETGEDVVSNPLTEHEQIKLLNTLYADYDWKKDNIDPGDIKVVVCQKALPSGYLPVALNKLYESNKSMVGWLVGEDRIADYAEQLSTVGKDSTLKDANGKAFKPDYPVLDQTAGNIIIPISRSGPSAVTMSGTEARHLSTVTDFKDWLAKVAPKGVSKNAAVLYKNIFNEMSSRLMKKEEDTYRKSVKGIFWGNL